VTGIPLALALALSAADPCAPIEPAPSPDPDAAARYRAVAEEEAAAGHAETAAVAWRKAAASDPGDAASREALRRACAAGREAPGADPLEEGIRLLDAGRYGEAAARFRAAQRARPTADAALLEGICRYELGEDAEAARLLTLAEADPAHRETARLYRGLVALREGYAKEAADLFAAAASSPTAAPFALELARAARWEGPWLVAAQAEGGYDSDVSLTSQGRGPARTGDAFAGAGATGILRPWGSNGLFLRAGGAILRYPTLSAYDVALVEGAAGVRWWRGASGASAEYALSDRTLGGKQLLVAHRFLAAGAWGLGPLTLSGSWQGRIERYAMAWSGYSGFAQRGDARFAVAVGPRVRIGAGWSLGRDDADAAVLSFLEQGPHAEVKVALDPTSRVSVDVARLARRYAEVDPALGVEQRDVTLDAQVAWEKDLGARVTLRLSLLVRNSSSNVAGFDYTKVVPGAGIGVMMTP
jgi:hypothetical protein